MRKYMGQQSWKIIWRPLLKKKFAHFYRQIAMTWVWARINRRSRFLGYPQGGFQVIVNKLVAEIKKNRGKVVLNKEIKNILEKELEN